MSPTPSGESARSRRWCGCPSSTVDAAVLQEFLAARIARWQVPERWAFIDEVPKTSVGKFDKKVLRKRYAEGDLQVETLA